MGRRSNGKGRTPRESVKLEARRAEVFRLWRDKLSLREIGSRIVPKMSPQLVAVDLQIAIEQFRDANRASIKQTAEMELAILYWVHFEAQRNHELSQDPKQRDKCADPRFMEIVMKGGDHRRKLLGLDKPTKIEAQTTTEVTMPAGFKTTEELVADVRKKQDEMAARLAEMEETDEDE